MSINYGKRKLHRIHAKDSGSWKRGHWFVPMSYGTRRTIGSSVLPAAQMGQMDMGSTAFVFFCRIPAVKSVPCCYLVSMVLIITTDSRLSIFDIALLKVSFSHGGPWASGGKTPLFFVQPFHHRYTTTNPVSSCWDRLLHKCGGCNAYQHPHWVRL